MLEKPDYESIYLVLMDEGWAWSTQPDPDAEHDPADAVKYINVQFVDQLVGFAIKAAVERVRSVPVAPECAGSIEDIIKAIKGGES